MKPKEYQKMYELGHSHWFFVCRQRFIASFLKNHQPKKNSLIFDAGCGPGINHLFLKQFGKVISLDLSLDALTFFRKKNLTGLVRGDLNRVNFRADSFDLVAALDVLYHSWVKDDRMVLEEFFRIIKPGGKLLITDSAFPFLLSRHDQAVMTRERYTLPVLKDKLHAVGFKTCRASYMFFTIFPVLAIVRFLQRFSFAADEDSSNFFQFPNWINRTILKVMNFESALLSRINLPFGSSVIILLEKPIE